MDGTATSLHDLGFKMGIYSGTAVQYLNRAKPLTLNHLKDAGTFTCGK